MTGPDQGLLLVVHAYLSKYGDATKTAASDVKDAREV
jgi:hypothetical protein